MTVVELERSEQAAFDAIAAEPGSNDGRSVPAGPIARHPFAFGRAINASLAVAVFSVVGFTAFFRFGTATLHDREQRSLRQEFRTAAASVTLDPQFEFDGDEVVGIREVRSGTALAQIVIPSLGVDEIVVEGTAPTDTMRGPGHLAATPLPGQYGNVVLIGRRTSFGGAFGDLDRLDNGDPIRMRGGLGSFTYVVREVVRAGAGDVTPFATRAGRNTLTLVTADADWSAENRLVVVAELRGRARGFSPSRVAPRAEELGLGTDRRAWIPLVFALQLLFVVTVGAVWLRHRWSSGCTWVVAVPVISAATWIAFEQAVRLLPASL